MRERKKEGKSEAKKKSQAVKESVSSVASPENAEKDEKVSDIEEKEDTSSASESSDSSDERSLSRDSIQVKDSGHPVLVLSKPD